MCGLCTLNFSEFYLEIPIKLFIIILPTDVPAVQCMGCHINHKKDTEIRGSHMTELSLKGPNILKGTVHFFFQINLCQNPLLVFAL